MRIKKLTLENFRCFRSTEIDLSADVVAIYGRNGVGKTAIFDGIELALLGDIGRYSKESSAPDYLNYAFGSEGARVRIEFDEGCPPLEVTCKRGNRSTPRVCLGGDPLAHRDFLYRWLLEPDYAGPRREVAPVRDVLRSTVLLSQDTIRGFVDGRTETRAEIMSYIAGSAYQQRCLEKAKQVVGEAESRLGLEKAGRDHLREKALDLTSRAAEQQSRIGEIRRKWGKAAVGMQDVLQALEEAGLQQSVKSESTQMEEPQAFAAAIRGVCLEREADLREKSVAVSEIEAMCHQHPERVARRSGLAQMVETSKGTLKSLLQKENSSSEAINKAERELQSAKTRVERLSARLLALGQLPELKQRLRSLQEGMQDVVKRREQMTRRLESARGENKKLQDQIEPMLAQISVAGANLNTLRQKLASVDGLKGLCPSYEANLALADELGRRRAKLIEKRSALNDALSRLREKHDALAAEHSTLSLDLARAIASTEESTALLSQLRQYAVGEKCPLCGHVHPTPEALQAGIDDQLKSLPTATVHLAKRVQELNAALTEVKTLRQSADSAVHVLDDEVKEVEERYRQVATMIREFKERVHNAGTGPLLKDIDARAEALARDFAQQTRALTALDEQRAILEARKKSVNDSIESMEAAITSDRSELEQLQSRIGAAQTDARSNCASEDFGKSDEAIAEQIDLVRGQLDREETVRRDLEALKASAEAGWTVSRTERAKLETDMKEWESTLARLAQEIEEYQIKCRHTGLPADSPKEQVAELRDRLRAGVGRLEVARQMAEKYEASIRASLLLREQDEVQGQLSTVQRDQRASEQVIARLQEASKIAAGWIGPVAESVNSAVENRIAVHHPEIVRMFKAMIPASYLFEDIVIERGEEGVGLGLKFRGMTDPSGEPKFFLSCAQANVLALAIFLSFSGSQSWSKLKTVMLDDPVQHLDDLDAVTFLDCLRGIALGKLQPKKQIVISTCDKNLYLLMIRKFMNLRAQGVSFTGISLLDRGMQGPKVMYDIGGPQNIRLEAKAV